MTDSEFKTDFCWAILEPPIHFVVHGRPQQRGSKKPMHVHKKDGSLATNKRGDPMIVTPDSNVKSRNWMNAVRDKAVEAMGERQVFRGPVILHAKFMFARPKSHFGTGRNANKLKASAPRWRPTRPDLSKLMRSLEDALSGVVYADDDQIIGYAHPCKQWAEKGEMTEVWVYEVDPDQQTSQPTTLF